MFLYSVLMCSDTMSSLCTDQFYQSRCFIEVNTEHRNQRGKDRWLHPVFCKSLQPRKCETVITIASDMRLILVELFLILTEWNHIHNVRRVINNEMRLGDNK